jgi:hypothetical protein
VPKTSTDYPASSYHGAVNKAQLQKLVRRHVRLRPVAARIDAANQSQLQPIDDRWMVSSYDASAGLSLSLSRTGHGFMLPFDHIREFVSDPSHAGDGFLMLKVQVYMSGDNLWVDPVPPG